jgi:hypothetical protein
MYCITDICVLTRRMFHTCDSASRKQCITTEGKGAATLRCISCRRTKCHVSAATLFSQRSRTVLIVDAGNVGSIAKGVAARSKSSEVTREKVFLQYLRFVEFALGPNILLCVHDAPPSPPQQHETTSTQSANLERRTTPEVNESEAYNLQYMSRRRKYQQARGIPWNRLGSTRDTLHKAILDSGYYSVRAADGVEADKVIASLVHDLQVRSRPRQCHVG